LFECSSMESLETQTIVNDSTPVEEVEQCDPWNVPGKVDYLKLVKEFGTQLLTPQQIKRFETLTGRPAHPWIRRGYFYSHRDFDEILNLFEAKQPFYLYTGRGPSSGSLHFGHLIPFVFCQYLQEVFNVPIVIQMTDDEKYLWKNIPFEGMDKYLRENVKDIIAIGFDVTKTFIFSDFNYVGQMYPNIVKIQKCVTVNQAKGIFGFTDSMNIGQMAFAAIQAAPSFPTSFPHIFGQDSSIRCLIPCAIDQDPYFRMTRDVAPRLGFQKPSLILSKFFPSLEGAGTKMGSSQPNAAIFLTDTDEEIKEKIKKHAFSGGRDTLEEHREKGGDCETDVPYQYLSFFLDDDEKLKDIHDRYTSGEMLSSEIKQILIGVMIERVNKHKRARALVTEDIVDAFMSVRKMDCFTKK